MNFGTSMSYPKVDMYQISFYYNELEDEIFKYIITTTCIRLTKNKHKKASK